MATLKSIEKRASLIIEEYNGKQSRIDVEKIARNMGLKIIVDDLGKNVTGVLFIKNGQGVIGYNPDENTSNVRKRFTIAHELGHYILHRLDNNIFVDKKEFKAVFRRDHNSTTGEHKQEREANAFAAALLMPEHLLIKEINKKSFDLGGDNDIINTLASKFEVSTQAMAYRIANLNLF